jgi:hypothetical protein
MQRARRMTGYRDYSSLPAMRSEHLAIEPVICRDRVLRARVDGEGRRRSAALSRRVFGADTEASRAK